MRRRATTAIGSLGLRVGVVVVAVIGAAAGLRAETPVDLTTATAGWLASLSDEQRDDAVYRFDDSERFDLRLAPFGLEGLRRDAMDEEQWQAWRAVLATTLSGQGLHKVETAMSLEREVRQRDRESWLGSLTGRFVHGEHRYFASVYGAPESGTAWGLRFDGHHLSLNWTVAPDGSISTTPLFIGAEPREVAAGWERAGLRVLAAEEDGGLAVWHALDPVQRERARLEFAAASGPGGGNRPLFLGAGGDLLQPGAPVGVAYRELSDEAQERLRALIGVYLSNFAAERAAERWAALEAAGLDAIHFAWAGSLNAGEPGYYRVHGPSFLIEWDDTMDAADHVHTIVRDFAGDFGRNPGRGSARDPLAAHYRSRHRPLLASAY